MFRELRKRARHSVVGRLDTDLTGFDLDLSPEEILADLQFHRWPAIDRSGLVGASRRDLSQGA